MGVPPLKTILFFSSDERLVHRIRQVLSGDERVMRLSPQIASFNRHGATHCVLVVLDCRTLCRSDVERAILRIRTLNDESYRCVAIADVKTSRRLEVVGHTETQDFDIILSDVDNAPMILRAILNDGDGSIGAAITLDVLRKHTTGVALRIAEAVLSSGCRISSVGAVETALDTDRAALGRGLADEGSPMPKAVIRVVRATYAIVLLRRTNLTLGKIAERIRYSASRWVQELLESEFGARAEELKSRTPDMPIEEFLEELLVDWKAGVAESAGGGGVTAATL
jgi:hypothetical protein